MEIVLAVVLVLVGVLIGGWLVSRLRSELVGDLVEIVGEYAEHGSWRCAHPPHFYFADGPPEIECACGLVADLRAAGLDDLADRFVPDAERPNV